MKLDLRPMLAEECRTLPIDYELVVQSDLGETSSNLYGVRFPSPMAVKGEIINTAGYMRMTLNLSLDYVTPCARCLREVAGTFSFTLEKTVAPRNILDNLDDEALDEYAIIEDGFLDIDEQLIELLELEFPSKILCKEDCKGLCQRCGKDLNEGPCNCKEEIDPRLAALQSILEELKESENKNS